MDNRKASARSMVDWRHGEISRDIFVNEEIYQQEREQIFARAWLYVGHESQLPKPGDYVVSSMGEESVILTRDAKGKIHVFLNSCRHRGMKVCRYDEGNTKTFVCPYHAWSYTTDGRLVGVQLFERAYDPPFDRSEWGLVEVAQLANFKGTIWATWDPKAPSFEDYLGDARFMLESGLTGWDGEGETELLGSVQKWQIPSNWKFVAENFAGDYAHGVSHKSVDMVGIGPNSQSGRRDEPPVYVYASYPDGHGIGVGKYPPKADLRQYSGSAATSAYFSKCWKKRLARWGERAGMIPVVGTIFPNMSFHGQQPRSILVGHPRGCQKTEIWRVYFVDKDAPPEVKDYLRHYYIRYAGPAGMTEQDDMENWNYASAASAGTIARRHSYNYKAGLGKGVADRLIPGLVTENPVSTEQNVRQLYKRWSEFMDAGDWTELQRMRGDVR